MLLFEFEGKRFLREHGVPTPRGVVVESARDVPGALADMPGPWMVKAQVLSGGRGKAGGVLPAETVAEAQAAAEKLLGSTLIGHPVHRLLVEERLPVKAEYYAAVRWTAPTSSRCWAGTAASISRRSTPRRPPRSRSFTSTRSTGSRHTRCARLSSGWACGPRPGHPSRRSSPG